MPDDVSVGTPVWYAGFTALVLAALVLDLGLFHRKASEVRIREAAIWTAVWISLAVLFGIGVFFWFGPKPGLEFFTGYIVEEALSVDNLFVFLVIFSYFSVPASYQHRVLFWGILGAMVMRGLFIFAGAALLSAFHWIMYLFGGFLILTSVKLLLQKDEEMDPSKNPVLRVFRRLVRSVPEYRETHFLVKEGGKWFATPLLAVLVTIETTDVVFATDSIPAIFGVTKDPFIVYTSNIFAILGLRSMFFVLSGMMGKFHYLKYGLSLILGLIGAKMIVFEIVHVGEEWKMTATGGSLGAVALVLALSIVLSLLRPPPPPPDLHGKIEAEAKEH
ncbi:MAG: TerC family protein [Planctomycetes bacterium]|jgi:tellurite resistance protein TerC|nr:TerC family protein [Planctomycetota bacterium]